MAHRFVTMCDTFRFEPRPTGWLIILSRCFVSFYLSLYQKTHGFVPVRYIII